MEALIFPDVHAHPPIGKAYTIYSCHPPYVEQAALTSYGLHPWYLTEGGLEDSLEVLRACLFQNQVVALGEAGLDKVCPTPWALQTKAWETQIQLAEEFQKPILIHCVRAFDEILFSLKNNRISVPVIFHGFNRNARIAEKIIHDGHYLSFGHHLLHPNLHPVFKSIPLQNIFLETDDSRTDIKKIYETAAAIHSLPLVNFASQIHLNIENIFKINVTRWTPLG